MTAAVLASFCALLPVEDRASCEAVWLPPPIEEACFSVTNYWPWDENLRLQPWNGQADSDPYHTAVMIPLTLDLEWNLAAVPLPLIGYTITLSSGVRLYGGDTFGAKAYQEGVFWHDHYQEWVVGVDVLTSDPLHYLDCGGSIS